ncbi:MULTISPECIES: hypothetical protein [unclassified Helicobacter]|uniref:hypothetical protein n=1 Tax=unclassified Helicobacter TaxID=2593540 RepID=UPI0012E71287|nr:MULTISPECIES: hypothetical protein [unclassified Helicobacter]
MFGKNADSAIMMRVELLTKLLRQNMQVTQTESKCALYQVASQTKCKIKRKLNAKYGI